MRSSIISVATTVMVLMTASVNGHMKLKSPVPYGQSTLDNSPLLADGSDFPCKQRTGVYDAEGAENVMTIGEPQTLSFLGSAVHGGGSCQVSLTTDLKPTKDSKWMVIKSIEGGCPASVPGNLPADPNGTGASTFQYTIPDGIAPGQYTLAWTWHNKVGNREMYMNCAPVEVQEKRVESAKMKRAESGKITKRTSFPNLFIANLAGINDCTTPESYDYIYPEPGDDVQTAGQGPFTKLSCGSAGSVSAAQPTAAASGATESSVLTAATVPSASQTVGTDTTAQAASPVFATGSAAVSGAPGVFVSVSVSSAAASATSEASPAATSASNSSDTSDAQSGACSPEGAWACSSDGSSFQRCASGTWSVPIEMDTGMRCQPGISTDIAMTPGKAKRHPHGHFRRMSRHWH
ncbi:hypothetical protein ABEF92_003205 [Exophiala dermatitidis]|uniref:DNA-directed RNA polymerase n=1 Tax=Exophiala dermatitidis (strain ATCC 34100 / CBS 525.76 / NIH/UT8656) TaxID=858893 RepID=H6BV97_EXODN|nr:DNA-directed RNA polymerase [Exophiala dermatitidis NIH/UT8656]EHY55011.1 DNA-directed RNA polymerase [Exophiala dermatitidis NIH/UT8656]